MLLFQWFDFRGAGVEVVWDRQCFGHFIGHLLLIFLGVKVFHQYYDL
jgi:hypothetical protein